MEDVCDLIVLGRVSDGASACAFHCVGIVYLSGGTFCSTFQVVADEILRNVAAAYGIQSCLQHLWHALCLRIPLQLEFQVKDGRHNVVHLPRNGDVEAQ